MNTSPVTSPAIKRTLSTSTTSSSASISRPKKKALKTPKKNSNQCTTPQPATRVVKPSSAKAERKVLGELHLSSSKKLKASKKLPSYVTPPRANLNKMINNFRELSTTKVQPRPAFEFFYDPTEYKPCTKEYWSPGENKENEFALKTTTLRV